LKWLKLQREKKKKDMRRLSVNNNNWMRPKKNIKDLFRRKKLKKWLNKELKKIEWRGKCRLKEKKRWQKIANRCSNNSPKRMKPLNCNNQ